MGDKHLLSFPILNRRRGEEGRLSSTRQEYIHQAWPNCSSCANSGLKEPLRWSADWSAGFFPWNCRLNYNGPAPSPIPSLTHGTIPEAWSILQTKKTYTPLTYINSFTRVRHIVEWRGHLELIQASLASNSTESGMLQVLSLQTYCLATVLIWYFGFFSTIQHTLYLSPSHVWEQ